MKPSFLVALLPFACVDATQVGQGDATGAQNSAIVAAISPKFSCVFACSKQIDADECQHLQADVKVDWSASSNLIEVHPSNSDFFAMLDIYEQELTIGTKRLMALNLMTQTGQPGLWMNLLSSVGLVTDTDALAMADGIFSNETHSMAAYCSTNGQSPQPFALPSRAAKK